MSEQGAIIVFLLILGYQSFKRVAVLDGGGRRCNPRRAHESWRITGGALPPLGLHRLPLVEGERNVVAVRDIEVVVAVDGADVLDFLV